MKSYRAVIIVFTLILSGLAALPVLASQWKVDVSWERFADIYQGPVRLYVSCGSDGARPGSTFVVAGYGFRPYEELQLLVNGHAPFYQGSQTFSLQTSEGGEVVINLHSDLSEPSGQYVVQLIGADQRIAQTYFEISRYTSLVCKPHYDNSVMTFEIPNVANLPIIIK